MTRKIYCLECGKSLRYVKWQFFFILIGVGFIAFGILGIIFRTYEDVYEETRNYLGLAGVFFIGFFLLVKGVLLRPSDYGETYELCINCIRKHEKESEIREKLRAKEEVSEILREYPELSKRVSKEGWEDDPYHVRELIDLLFRAREFESQEKFGEAEALYRILEMSSDSERMANLLQSKISKNHDNL